MLILERLRGSEAVISGDSGEFTVPADMVQGCREGDVIVLTDGVYRKDAAATERRREYITALQSSLWDDE